MEFKLKKISGDASFREFYRIQKKTNISILIRSSKEKFKNLIVYAAVNDLLRRNKIKAPKLINQYFDEEMMEIENLGDHSFLEIIKKKKSKLGAYKKLVNILIKIQKIKFKKKIKYKKYKIKFNEYNLSELHKESDLFFEWYLKNNCRKKNFLKFKKKIRNELNDLYKKLYFKNNCFVHRDFHADNIMVKKKVVGIIDSQDAIKGNPLYDVASLIDDVRVKTNNSFKISLLKYYLTKTKKIKKEQRTMAKQDLSILSIQRNLKILGIFVRLYKRDGKPNYLKFLPYTWKLIELRMNNEIFNNLKKLLNYAVPKKNRNKMNFNAN